MTNDGSVRIIESPDGPLYICDLKTAGDTVDIPLSELVEDCRIYNPQNEMFRLLGTKRSFSQNETFFFSHP